MLPINLKALPTTKKIKHNKNSRLVEQALISTDTRLRRKLRTSRSTGRSFKKIQTLVSRTKTFR